MVLSVASGSTRQIASGSTVYANQVDLAGEINLTGTLTTGDALVSAAGTGDGTGTATANPKLVVAAAGVGNGVAFETEFDRLQVNSGTTQTVASGSVLDTGTLDLAGEINVSGELQIEEAQPVALYGSFNSASGVGEGLNYVFDFDPLTVASDDTFTVASDETSRVGQIDLAGELNLEGDLQTVNTSATATPQRLVDAAGTGDGTGEAIATPQATVSASGIGEGVGSASVLVRAFVSASGVGEGTGTADALPRRLVSAAGVGEATASNPAFVISVPLVRGNADDVDWHEDDDIDLGADSDGTR
jgi:hypothetical protein